MDEIDKAAKTFAREWERVRSAVEKLYQRLEKMGDPGAAMEALAQLNLQQVLLDDLNFQKTLERMAAAHVAVLASAEAVAPVPEVYLQALVKISNQAVVARSSAGFAEMMKVISGAVVDRLPEEQVIDMLEKTGITRTQAEALANNTLRTFSRQVSAIQAEEADPDQLWIYEGPVDDRTTEICLEILAAGPMTKDEIDARFPGAFINGGHYNCRHEFHPFTRRRQYEKSKIDRQIEKRALQQVERHPPKVKAAPKVTLKGMAKTYCNAEGPAADRLAEGLSAGLRVHPLAPDLVEVLAKDQAPKGFASLVRPGPVDSATFNMQLNPAFLDSPNTFYENLWGQFVKMRDAAKAAGRAMKAGTEKLTRYSVVQDAADPLYAEGLRVAWQAIGRRKAYKGHVLAKSFDWFWERAGKDAAAVSVLAGTDATQAFAEVATAVQLGIKIPETAKKVLLESLERVGLEMEQL